MIVQGHGADYSLSFLATDWVGYGCDLELSLLFRDDFDSGIQDLIGHISEKYKFINILAQGENFEGEACSLEEYKCRAGNSFPDAILCWLETKNGLRFYVEILRPCLVEIGAPVTYYYSGNMLEDRKRVRNLVEIAAKCTSLWGPAYWAFDIEGLARQLAEKKQEKDEASSLESQADLELVIDGIVHTCTASRMNAGTRLES